MINLLLQRSLVDRVFVSSYSSAKQAFTKHDLDDHEALPKLENTNGTTKEFLNFLKENPKVCVFSNDQYGRNKTFVKRTSKFQENDY
ncbi:hypothetical protein RMATCC62417_18287 [Rhizopus microsporus]|nr:hypothetical protein RMATCC62417_18287 [Rhizopus microsporus]